MAMLTPEMQQLVREMRLGFVATVCPDGTPNVSPKGTLLPWEDDQLIFADIRSPGTVANLQHNPTIEVNVVNWLTRRGYRFKGRADVLVEGDLFQQFVAFYEQRGLFDAPRRIQAIVVIHVENVRPLISPGYDQETSIEQVKARWTRYYDSLK